MEEIISKYAQLCRQPSDINEHLPTLKHIASQCQHITEMGVREVVSTIAFLAAKPKKLVCYDIHKHPNVDSAIELAQKNGISMEFHEADVLKVKIKRTDLLFIDTLHIYSQLKKELKLHAKQVSKCIVLHDTTTYATLPEPADWQTPAIMKNYKKQDKGIWPAVQEFLDANKKWSILHRFENNNGLTVLAKA